MPSHVYLVFQRALGAPIADVCATVPLTVKVATHDDVDEVGVLDPDHDLRSRFRDRLDAGHLCLIARVGTTLVGYHWVAFRPFTDVGVRIEVAPGQAYSYDVLTAPAWRGFQINTELQNRALLAALAAGCRTHFAHIALTNRKSWKTPFRLGFRLTGCYVMVDGLGRARWQWLWPLGSTAPAVRTAGRWP